MRHLAQGTAFAVVSRGCSGGGSGGGGAHVLAGDLCLPFLILPILQVSQVAHVPFLDVVASFRCSSSSLHVGCAAHTVSSSPVHPPIWHVWFLQVLQAVQSGTGHVAAQRWIPGHNRTCPGNAVGSPGQRHLRCGRRQGHASAGARSTAGR